MTNTDLRAHFSLCSLPFTRELEVSGRWRSEIFEEPLDGLLEAVRERMSATLIAPAGTGKTALLRALVAGLPEAQYRVHYLKVVDLSKRDFCREIAAVAGLAPVGTYPHLVRKLGDRFLNGDVAGGLRPVLLIDEAQGMRPEVLGILSALTNYDMDSRLVLSCVLAGQPALGRLLIRDDLEAIRQRVAHHATLRLLSRAETRAYMEHRMNLAAARTFPYDDKAVDAVYEISRGNLRAIDQLARKALQIAARKSITTIDPGIVLEARKSLP